MERLSIAEPHSSAPGSGCGSLALLRPAVDTASQERLRDVILAAYKEHKAALAEAV